MAQYDIETVLGDIQSFLLANLNTQISELNAEKNDATTLKPVDSTSYHLQYLEDRVDVSDPLLVYGEADEPLVQSMGDSVAVTYKVGVWLVLADNGIDPNIVIRLFRYRRVLVDLFRLNWANFAREHKLKIAEATPTPPYKDLETGYVGRAVGVMIALTIAT